MRAILNFSDINAWASEIKFAVDASAISIGVQIESVEEVEVTSLRVIGGDGSWDKGIKEAIRSVQTIAILGQKDWTAVTELASIGNKGINAGADRRNHQRIFAINKQV